MKKIYQLLGIIAVMALTACEDVAYKTNLGKVTDDVVWTEPQFVRAYFDNVMFNAIPGWERGLMGASDESVSPNGSTAVVHDLVEADHATGGGYETNLDRWPYETMRKINRFLDHTGYDGFVSSQPVTDKLSASEKEDMTAQMLVVRAYNYFDMVRVYGGVPLLLHEQAATLNFEDLQTPRAKTSECIAQIIKDLNAAINTPDASFPMKRADGHIGKGAAYALKAKVLLYYASPQFTKQTPAGTKPAAERWNDAYAACKEAYDKLTAAGFGLYAPDGGDKATVMENYYKMLVTDELNPEMIWVRRYSPVSDWSFPIDGWYRPISAGGTQYGVSWEIAGSFSNADGTPFTALQINYANDANQPVGGMTQGATVTGVGATLPDGPDGDPVNTAPFWLDREPRFYAFVGYNGCEWPLIRLQQSSFAADVTDGKMQHEWVFCSGASIAPPFSSGYGATNERGNPLPIRKFTNRETDMSQPAGSTARLSGTDWPILRFAELMLSLAETAAMTGKPQEAYDMLDAIRKRAGIPEGGNHYGLGRKTGDALILDILNERKIELFAESNRYYDVRRWRMFSDGVNGVKLNGLRRHTIQAWLKDKSNGSNNNQMISLIQKILDAGGIDTEAGREAYFDVFYQVVMVQDSRNFQYNPDRQDFYRIPYLDHVQKNPLIQQTIGWTDERGAGTFNPYE